MSTLLGMTVEPHVTLFARIIVGAILLSSGVSKVGDHRRFADIVQSYGLLPTSWARAVGRVLPTVEILVAAGILLGFWLPWSALGALGLFLIFGAAVAINLARGRHDLDCGCFGSGRARHLSWALVARNSVLAGLALVAALSPTLLALPWDSSPLVSSAVGVAAEEVGIVTLAGVATVILPWLFNSVWILRRQVKASSQDVTVVDGHS